MLALEGDGAGGLQGRARTASLAGPTQDARIDGDQRKRAPPRFGYNVQIAVDAEHNLDRGHEVTNQGRTDNSLCPMALRGHRGRPRLRADYPPTALLQRDDQVHHSSCEGTGASRPIVPKNLTFERGKKRLLHPAGLILQKRARPYTLPGGRQNYTQGQFAGRITPKGLSGDFYRHRSGGFHLAAEIPVARRLSAAVSSGCGDCDGLDRGWSGFSARTGPARRDMGALATKRTDRRHTRLATLKAWMAPTNFLTRPLGQRFEPEVRPHVFPGYNLKRMITISGGNR